MNLKQTRYIAIIGIFILNFLFHFAYDVFPNTLFSIFFPVNESIFEHQKMIFSSFMFYAVIDYFILKKNNISRRNFLLSAIISAFSTIGVFLTIWLPTYYKIGENMILTIAILLISIIISQVVSYYILKSQKEVRYASYITIIVIVLTYIALAYLTYYPPKTKFFFDPIEEKYGINTYVIN